MTLPNEIFDVTLEWIVSLPLAGLFMFLFAAAIIENIFPPWPGDTFIVFSGFVYASQPYALLTSFIASTGGTLTGALIMYFAGEKLFRIARSLFDKQPVDSFWNRLFNDIFSEAQLKKSHLFFERWGMALVLFSRFSSGIRFFISIVAGIARMNLFAFIICYTLGSVLWVSLLMGGGYLLKEKWESILTLISMYNGIFIALLILGITLYVIVKLRRSKTKRAR